MPQQSQTERSSQDIWNVLSDQHIEKGQIPQWVRQSDIGIEPYLDWETQSV
jgi:hypothetical protein